MTKKPKLNDKQKLFCEEYIVDLNGTQAYIRAGYSPKGARTSASRMLSNVNIQEYIIELKAKRLERVRVSQDYVLEKLVEVVEFNSQRQALMSTVEGEPDPETGRPRLDTKIVETHINSDMVHKAVKTIGDHLEMFKNVTKEAPQDDRPPEEIAVDVAQKIINERMEKDG